MFALTSSATRILKASLRQKVCLHVWLCHVLSMIVVAGFAAASRFGEFVGAGVIFGAWNGSVSASNLYSADLTHDRSLYSVCR